MEMFYSSAKDITNVEIISTQEIARNSTDSQGHSKEIVKRPIAKRISGTVCANVLPFVSPISTHQQPIKKPVDYQSTPDQIYNGKIGIGIYKKSINRNVIIKK